MKVLERGVDTTGWSGNTRLDPKEASLGDGYLGGILVRSGIFFNSPFIIDFLTVVSHRSSGK
jgi:hypothetical protein